jgi:hypothetical protein
MPMTRNVTAVSATDSQRFLCLCLLLHYFIKTHEPCTKVSVSSDSRRHYRSMMGDSHSAARQSCHSDIAQEFSAFHGADPTPTLRFITVVVFFGAPAPKTCSPSRSTPGLEHFFFSPRSRLLLRRRLRSSSPLLRPLSSPVHPPLLLLLQRGIADQVLMALHP